MKKLFTLAASVCCGALVACAPVRTTKDATAQAHYYFLSASALARDLQNKGFMQFVATGNGQFVYTHHNTHGRKPMRDARLVWLRFGRKSAEVRLIVDRDAYAGHLARLGSRPKPVLVSAPPRPDAAITDIDPPRNRLG